MFFCVRILILVIWGWPLLLWAAEDDDLRFLPQGKDSVLVAAPATKEASGSRYNLYFEQTGALLGNRSHLLVPPPPVDLVNSFSNSSVDAVFDMKLLSSLRLNFSDRFDYFYYSQSEQDEALSQNTLRELYFSWNPYRSFFFEAGRINIKNGVAIGFNPTDYFKRNAVDDQLSQDLQVLRDKRLGALMLKTNFITSSFSLLAAYAPQVSTRPNDFLSDQEHTGLFLNRTNATNQFLGQLTLDLGHDWNPEFLYYQEGENSSYGFNLSHGLGKSLVFYFEWSGSDRPFLGSEGTKKYLATVAPETPPLAIDYDSSRVFYNQVATGFSVAWSSAESTYFEYHYNQAGFTQSDWDKWFKAGQIANQSTLPAQRLSGLGQLWSVRDYARNNLEPMSQHSFFIRNSWSITRSQDLTAVQLLDYNLQDQSLFAQLQFDYNFNRHLTISFLTYWNVGAENSEYGSIPREQEFQLGLKCYL